ncbi:SDR family oxidoreductase [Marinibacterium profundimaris]|uniref:3-oxoacyl-ACP reductase n=1 Tax=Marinibacterium profundimaris TaxID=1679460 RepID=A0A225NLV3_9RHOB|nr:SDR family oxidoreductase [Marinibacterium profundimaris]OWU75026.1 3-oxoacyl-ACP reductase [Marinibacterium profundimaris]
MDLGLTGKTALVLGASRGLGAASATLLAAEGAHLIAASRSGTAPAEGMEGLALDLSDPASVDALIARLADQPVDILVNNCGGPAAGPARGQSTAAWAAAFEAMATPIFAITDAALPGMIDKGWGRVVTIGSSGMVQPIPNLALSNGVRGAVAGWSKTLAEEVAPHGVTVNIVMPGRIATDRLAQLDGIKAEKTGASLDDVQEASRKTIPAGRYGKPEEFGAMVTFLCSQQAAYVTGSMLRVDGGLIRGL